MMSREIAPKRKYELKKRADEMAKTHLRITEAAIDLHGTVGPARTTLSAVAKRAGVERRTLYRHFPTESDLFAACSSPLLRRQPVARSRRLARDSRSAGATRASARRALRLLRAHASRCSTTSSAMPSSSTSPATPWPRCTRTSTKPPRSSPSAGRPRPADDSCSRRHSATPWPSQPGTHSRPTASGDRMRKLVTALVEAAAAPDGHHPSSDGRAGTRVSAGNECMEPVGAGPPRLTPAPPWREASAEWPRHPAWTSGERPDRRSRAYRWQTKAGVFRS